MKGLDSLIRIHRFQVDERQRALAALEARRRALLDRLARLDAEQSAEMINARGMEGGGAFYASYAEAAKSRREELGRLTSDVDAEIAIAQTALREAFEALKKYEIVEENVLNRKRAEEAREAQNRLDDLAGQRAARGA